jgi:hypothetical protein
MKIDDIEKIELKKVINQLDMLILDVLEILEQYTPYVVVGGYVSILFGRSRMSEDIDILIPPLDFETFNQFYNELTSAQFWSINAESVKTNYELLTDNHAIRITRKDWVIPNVEIRFISTPTDKISFDTLIKVSIPPYSIKVARPEVQIIYKREVLGSDKDIEDALHLEEIFKAVLDETLLNTIRRVIRDE